MRGAIISNEWTNGNTEHVVWKGIREKKKKKKHTHTHTQLQKKTKQTNTQLQENTKYRFFELLKS